MFSSRNRVIALLTVLIGFAAACGGGGRRAAPADTQGTAQAPAIQAQGDGVLAFGNLLPETGDISFYSPPTIAGVNLAAEEINKAGGVLGQKVSVALGDSGDNSTDIATQTIDRHLAAGVDVIIGAVASGVSLTVIDKITGAGKIMFSPANTSKRFTDYPDRGLYFRTAPSDLLQGRVLGELVASDGNATAVVMSRDDSYGNGLREDTIAAFEAQGGEVLDNFAYEPNAQNYDAEVQKVVSANPDAVVVIGFDETARILARMIEQGVGPAEKNLYGTDGNMTATLPAQVNPQNRGVLQGMKGTAPRPNNDAFYTRLMQFQPNLADRTYSAESYDAVIITALAAEIAGTDAPGRVAAEIKGVTQDGEKCTTFADCKTLIAAGQNIDYDGASGPLEFTNAGEPGAGNYAIMEFQADGSVKIIDNQQVTL
jgi:branched-chain amino acid transport system substrate-binding protein